MDLNKPKILVVDDDPELRKATVRIIASGGYDVIEADNGTEALSLTEIERPDVILLDVVMPDIDGVEVCRRIKANPSIDSFIIFLSGMKTASDHQALGLESGADGYIIRPIANRELFARLESVLRLKKAETALRQAREELEMRVQERTAQLEISNELLRESERKYRELVENANSIILRWNRDGKITFMNEFGQQFFGYTEAEILGRHVLGTIVPETESTGRDLGPLMDRICANPKDFEQNINENMRRNGERVWISWTNKTVLDRQGQVLEVLSIGSDITERKRAEEALHESEDIFRAIASNTPDHILIQDSELRYIFVINPQLGLTEQDMLGKTDYDFLSREEADKLTQVKRQVMETDKPHHIETSLISKEGNPEFFDGTYISKFDAQGNVDGLIGYFRNITERKKAEEALRESEEIFRKVFEEGPLCIAMASLPDGRLISANRALCEMLGYREEELKRLTFLDVTHPDHRSVDIEAVKDLQAGLIQTHKTEKRYLKKNGEVIWAMRALTKIASSEGKSPYALSMIEDITDRKQAEEELQKYHDHLEDLVKERTLELEEAQEAMISIVEDLNEKSVQLVQAMEQVQSADRLKSAFLATMSHELRTPLNSIIGFTGIVLQGMSGPLNDEQAKQLTMAKGSANHLLDLINDVLDISKIEAGQVQILRRPFDMRSAIETALRTVFPLAEKKGLSLDSVIVSDVGVIISDRRRVEQILINLVNNAIKFTEQGKIRVSAGKSVSEYRRTGVSANGSNGVTAEGRVGGTAEGIRSQEIESGGNFVEISVTDTGIGIKAEDMDNIFKPFTQIDTGLTRNYEGTGLGLSICEKLVTMLGGTIRVESEWGKGSKFTFTLPLSS